ncbi:hypothetical protein NMY22_g243 [Coprinellus aureogranulatus]|nr:hypothetical protein NMY22_g243 [Coprinellus aureogranulatus]
MSATMPLPVVAPQRQVHSAQLKVKGKTGAGLRVRLTVKDKPGVRVRGRLLRAGAVLGHRLGACSRSAPNAHHLLPPEFNAMDSQSEEPELHSVRITSQGKIKNWVAFALKTFEERPDLPITFHTMPPTPSTSKLPPKDVNIAQKQKLASSTALVPRLVSVVEIVKREYMKDLKEKRASRMKGLYQYNEVGILEEEQGGESDEDEEEESANREGRRAEKIIEALSGKNHVRQTQTPFMRVTLSTFELPHLQAAGATYQPPETRKLTKSAKARAAKRRKREGGEQEGGEGDRESVAVASSGRVPAKPPISPGDVSMDDS